MKMAVIGKDVSQSQSPSMHTFIMKHFGVDITYDKISINPEEFNDKFESLLTEYDTLNITIPFKLDCIPFLNKTLDDAATFGAVNTIECKNKYGYNTDGMGFMLMLENGDIDYKGKTILVLGSGGVGRSVIKKMLDAGCKVDAFDLNQEGMKLVHEEFPEFTPLTEIEIKPYDIIINCTGVGMHKSEGKSPVGRELIELSKECVDLIYVPEKSRFLEIAEECGKKILNGASMLFYQAYYGDCIFLNKPSDAKEAKQLYEAYRK